jgi:glucan phosphoethanolaminetransferase (alkaline phosphatase superfamily)
MIDLNLKPRTKVLRQFSLIWLLLFVGLGTYYYLKQPAHGTRPILLLAAAVLGIIGLIWPFVIRPIYQIAVIVTFPIGWVVSQAVLILMYYGVVTPLGLLLRVMRPDPLSRNEQPNAASYWSDKPQPADLRSYFRQY